MSLLRPQKTDLDFMSELEAATRMRPATSATLMFFSIVALVIFGVIWAGVSQVEEITRGQGRVVPSQEVQVLQSLEGGILQELLVRTGDQVKKDQILLRISDVNFSSEERGTEARLRALRAKKARLNAEALGEDFIVPKDILAADKALADNEMALYKSRQNELTGAYKTLEERLIKADADINEITAQINRLYQNRKLLNQEIEITVQMVKKRAAPKLDQIRLERELADINGQLNANAQRKKSLESERAVIASERAAQEDRFRTSALGELSSVDTDINAMKESLRAVGDRVSRTELRSPVDGTINNIALTTIGGVIEPAQRLIEIVPLGGELKIIAEVSPSDIAFIHPGQAAKVKITAYDAQKYGSLEGALVRLGSNSVNDGQGNVFFEIEVRTAQNYMGSAENPLPITSGMVAEVEIITGKRTILEYLLKPIFRARSRAFTER